MPIVILVIAVLLVVAGLNNKLSPNSQNSGSPTLAELVKSDFVPDDGSVSFTIWVGALIVIGALGYVKELKPFSNAFLVLVILAILIKGNGQGSAGQGFFNNLFAFFENPNTSQSTQASTNGGLGVGTGGVTDAISFINSQIGSINAGVINN